MKRIAAPILAVVLPVALVCTLVVPKLQRQTGDPATLGAASVDNHPATSDSSASASGAPAVPQDSQQEKARRYLKYLGIEPSGAALREAVTESRTYSIKLLLQAGVDVNFLLDNNETPMFYAVRQGNTDVITLLIENGSDLNFRDAEGRTPLMLASEGAPIKVAQVLLEAGAEIDTPDALGRRAIHYVVAGGDLNRLETLLQAGASVDPVTENEPSVLAQAFEAPDPAILGSLLAHRPARLGWDRARTDLFWRAYQAGDHAMLDLLTAAHQEPPPLPGATQPLLGHAVLWNDAALVRRLLDWGANPDTPLRIPADPHFIDTTGKDGLRYYLENERGMTVLMLAAGLGYDGCVEALLDAGATRNARTEKYNMVALNFAGRTGTAESIQLLLGKGPDEKQLKIEISISTQHATVFKDGIPWLKTTVSTGRDEFPTPTGRFVITDKRRSHISTIYDVPMPYFMRLSDRDFGMHEGHVPGYAASHGCIRVPSKMARELYKIAEVGTLVTIVE